MGPINHQAIMQHLLHTATGVAVCHRVAPLPVDSATTTSDHAAQQLALNVIGGLVSHACLGSSMSAGSVRSRLVLMLGIVRRPVALEDHALQACIAALEIQAVTKDLAAEVLKR
jgi:hypothetical protein